MPRGQRFETLDGMRGLCALIVAIYHSGLALGRPNFPSLGQACVCMFFVLSGFVIALTYEERLKAGTGFSAFLKARGQRLLPVQIVGTAICFLAAIPYYLHDGLTGAQIALFGIAGLILLPIVWTPLSHLGLRYGVYPANPVTWSLHAEWVINLIYGKWLYRVSIAGLMVFCLFALVTDLWLEENLKVLWLYPFQSFCQGGFGFILGVILFRLRPRLSRLPAIGPYLIYGAWALLCGLPHYELTALNSAVACLVAAVFLSLLIRNEQPVAKPFIFLGRVSYPLYACHMAVISISYWLFASRGIHNGLLAIPVVGLALLLATGLERLTSPNGRASPKLGTKTLRAS